MILGQFGGFQEMEEIVDLLSIRKDNDAGSCCLAELDDL